MSFQCLKLLRIVRTASIIRNNALFTSATVRTEPKSNKIELRKEFKTEDSFVYLDDPDSFGTLSSVSRIQDDALDDEGDLKEQEYIEDIPLRTKKLTIKQYSDIIKQYLEHKRLKEAIDVLEVRMLKQDRVKPSNYIYNILIGACAEVGYTKKAFKLYNEMKRRALTATGDTYTCLFEACANSPWAADGLKNATHLKNLMFEKGIEPNLTNYNAMIKAFGRCGDLATAFQIVDEMMSKKIKIRVHSFNHLLQACISDKETGLRHALVVWRKMLRMKEKPNIYSFNLMLKCIKECNMGNKKDIEELLKIIEEETPLAINQNGILQIESSKNILESPCAINSQTKTTTQTESLNETSLQVRTCHNSSQIQQTNATIEDTNNRHTIVKTNDVTVIQFVDKLSAQIKDERTVPNLLSKSIKLNQVLAIQEVKSEQDKFAIVGGQEDFIKEMQIYDVKPDVKTFTQMLMLLENTTEAENKLLDTMKSYEIKADIDFYNMLIKKRCLRTDYDSAIEVKEIIEKENKRRKRKYPWKKHLHLKLNVMSYGVLAMACRSKETAEQLLGEMKEKQLRVNIQILGTLLRHGTAHNEIEYVLYILNEVKKEDLKVNNVFLKHLEVFNHKCRQILRQVDKIGITHNLEEFKKAYKKFLGVYENWLKDVNIQDALKPEHPWQQFKENYPETLQRSNVKIIEPKRFYKPNRKFIKYTPRI